MEENGVTITDPKKIARRYVPTIQFLFDVVSII
jgi:hypothetical protein